MGCHGRWFKRIAKGKIMRGKWIATIMLTGAFIGSAAAAQMPGGTNGDSFLSAVRESDGNKAISLIQGNGSTVVNYRGAKGETALNIATRRRDMTWVGYIIGAGADPNAGDDRGETPLIIAARLGWSEGASTLLKTGARVDLANKLGETPLIVAVQQRQPALVKLAPPTRRRQGDGRPRRRIRGARNGSSQWRIPGRNDCGERMKCLLH